MSNLTFDEENPLQIFLYALRAAESKRQYPRRLKVVLDYLKEKSELKYSTLDEQCKEFIMKTRENPKWANNQLMQFVLFQKQRVESGEIVSTTIRNYIKAAKLFLEMNFDVPLVNWKRITKSLPAPKNASNDRAPSLAELKILMAYPDRRIKPIILCMISGAFRIGAWNYLKWKHVTPIKSEKTGEIISRRPNNMTENRADSVPTSQIESESEFATALKKAGLNSIRHLVAIGPLQISKIMDIPLEKAVSIYNWAHAKLEANSAIHSSFDSAENFYVRRNNNHKLSTGSIGLNRLLLGGIETRALTEFYGASGSGKTQLCFTLCVMVQQPILVGGLNGKAIYIDTEHKFRPERIFQIASSRGFDTSNVLKNISFVNPFDSSRQEKNIYHVVSLLQKVSNIKLLIVDSIISHYRSEFVGRESLPQRQHRLYKSLRMLANIAEIYDIAVVVTNQIQTSPDYLFADKTVSTGGNVTAHAATHRIQLRYNNAFGGIGIANMVNSPYHPPSQVKFAIKETGICDEE